jgi:hypothetical protein
MLSNEDEDAVMMRWRPMRESKESMRDRKRDIIVKVGP